MDKIKELEKRIQKLESFIQLMRMNNDENNRKVKALRGLIPDQDGFEKKFLKKYSSKEYRKKGFSGELNKLDINDALSTAKNLGDKAKQLHYWMEFQNDMTEILGLDAYIKGEYWQELRFFVMQFIGFYQNAIVERVLKEGKHYEGSGNRPLWDPEKTVIWWDELYPNYSDKKTSVYNEIRKRHNPNDLNKDKNGVPNNPSQKTITNHLKDAGRI